MLGRRAQTEDFLADLLPAMIIIIIGLVFGQVFSLFHTSHVEKSVDLAAMQFNGMDILSLLHVPVEGYGDFAYLAASVAEAYEGKDKDFFESGGIARLGSEYAECGEGFEGIVGDFFADKNWVVYIYEVSDVGGGSPGKMIFKCDNLGSLAESAIARGVGIRYSEAYLPSAGLVAYKVTVGWKDG